MLRKCLRGAKTRNLADNDLTGLAETEEIKIPCGARNGAGSAEAWKHRDHRVSESANQRDLGGVAKGFRDPRTPCRCR